MLDQIRSKRSSSLQFNSNRKTMIDNIKEVKCNNFIYKMNQKAQKICDQNIKMFDRLEKYKNKSNKTINSMHI